MKIRTRLVLLMIIAAIAFLPIAAMAITIDPFYAGSYTAVD